MLTAQVAVISESEIDDSIANTGPYCGKQALQRMPERQTLTIGTKMVSCKIELPSSADEKSHFLTPAG